MNGFVFLSLIDWDKALFYSSSIKITSVYFLLEPLIGRLVAFLQLCFSFEEQPSPCNWTEALETSRMRYSYKVSWGKTDIVMKSTSFRTCSSCGKRSNEVWDFHATCNRGHAGLDRIPNKTLINYLLLLIKQIHKFALLLIWRYSNLPHI